MHRKQLDGIRGAAFVCVFLVHHALDRLWYLGYALAAFFTLSGFLITRSLVQNETGEFRQDLFRFYARRWLRIFPPYYLLLVVLMFLGRLPNASWHLTYLFNLKLFLTTFWDKAVNLTPWDKPILLLSRWEDSGGHFWSLCVEEQFYLLYPLLLLACRKRFRPAMVAGLIAVSIAVRAVFMGLAGPAFYGALLPVCGEYILWGCLAYLLMEGGFLRRFRPAQLLYAGILLASTVALFQTPHKDPILTIFFRATHRQTLAAAGFALIVAGLWGDDGTIPARILSLPPLPYLGRISYGLYLLHLFTFSLFDAMSARWPALQMIPPPAGRFLLTLVPAMISWHFFEEPIQRFGARFRRKSAVRSERLSAPLGLDQGA